MRSSFNVHILEMYIIYVTYNVYIYIFIHLCIVYISSHSKGPEQDQLRSPFVPYVRNTAERSIHNFDSGPYIYIHIIQVVRHIMICTYVYKLHIHIMQYLWWCVGWFKYFDARSCPFREADLPMVLSFYRRSLAEKLEENDRTAVAAVATCKGCTMGIIRSITEQKQRTTMIYNDWSSAIT